MRYLGLDLGGTNIKGVVVEVKPDGVPVALARASAPTHAAEGPEAVTNRIVALGLQLAEAHPSVHGVGVGVPGLFNTGTGVIDFFTNLPGPWPGFPLRDCVADRLGVPALVMNDARAFTLAEGRMGAGQGASTMVGITLGTGVGGGVLINGRLHLGRWGTAGEIGHVLVSADDGAAPCGCGVSGCVEAYARADVLCALAGRASAEEVYAAAREGDPVAASAVLAVARHLGTALASVVNVLGPDRIVVGGGIAAAGDTLLDPLRTALRGRIRLVPVDEVDVVPAVLGSYAGAMGAAIAAADAA